MRIFLQFVLVFAFLFATRARSQSLGKVKVINHDVPIKTAPAPNARKRGALAIDTILPYFAIVPGEKCKGGWVQIGGDAFVCAKHLRPTNETVHAISYPRDPGAELLPRRFAFVAFDGTRVFKHPSQYFTNDFVSTLGKGYSVTIAEEEEYEGVYFARTRRGQWIERGSLNLPRASSFQGVHIKKSKLDFAWTPLRRIDAFARSGGRGRRMPIDRRTLVRIKSTRRHHVETDAGFLHKSRLITPELQPRPDAVQPDELWLDLSIRSQVLMVYRGDIPIYATLVSSGAKKKDHETPLGEHRIWVKLAYSDMNNFENTAVSSNYALRDVPWVQYFAGANGFHTAFWHDDFGKRKSHGCINLSPRDAQFLFENTSPRLPKGWTAAFPTEKEKGTLIRVRK